MTDEIQEDVAEETVAEEGTQSQEEGQESLRDPEAEAEARKYGWRPKEEFDRDPEGWVDADRFLQLPSTGKKMLRDELREVKSDFAVRMERMEKANKAVLDRALEDQKRQYEEKIAKVRYDRREAASEGDTERYDRLDLEERKLLQSAPKEPEVQQEGPDPYIAEYSATESGAWLNDPILRDFAARSIDLAKGAAGATAREQIAYAESKVKEYYPHKFAPPKQKTSKVDGGGLAGGKLGNNKLPPEAKKAAAEFIEQGIFKNEAEYAKVYFEQG